MSTRELARQHPGWFALHAGQGLWKVAPHLQLISQHLGDAAAGDIRRLMISVPPGSGKSELVSRYFPAWYLGTHPRGKVILTSYQADFAARWGAAARDVLKEFGPDLWGVRPRTAAAASHWEVHDCSGKPLGGMMWTAGAAGSVTGKHANIFIIDDPFKGIEDAYSPTLREKVWQWYLAVARSRLLPGATIIIVQTRWHEEDLCGRLMDQDAKRIKRGDKPRWRVINIPAIAEEDGDPLGRQAGDPLWPSWLSLDQLIETREEVGPYVWSALYQGRPTPTEGGLFKRDWLNRYREIVPGIYHLPGGKGATRSDLTTFAVVDVAGSKGKSSDFTVISIWGITKDRSHMLLLDLVRKRLEGPDVIPMVSRVADAWGCGTIWMEESGLGLPIVQQARRNGMPVRGLRAHTNKVARALGATPYFESGCILLPEDADWLPGYESELLLFPNAKHDDQVDVTSYATDILRRVPRPERSARMGPTGGPDKKRKRSKAGKTLKRARMA